MTHNEIIRNFVHVHGYKSANPDIIQYEMESYPWCGPFFVALTYNSDRKYIEVLWLHHVLHYLDGFDGEPYEMFTINATSLLARHHSYSPQMKMAISKLLVKAMYRLKKKNFSAYKKMLWENHNELENIGVLSVIEKMEGEDFIFLTH